MDNKKYKIEQTNQYSALYKFIEKNKLEISEENKQYLLDLIYKMFMRSKNNI